MTDKIGPASEPRLVSYDLDMQTCTLNFDGEEYYFDRVGSTRPIGKLEIIDEDGKQTVDVYAAPPDLAARVAELEQELNDANNREAYESGLASSRALELAEANDKLRVAREALEQAKECKDIPTLLRICTTALAKLEWSK